jgi:hypothetical protein
MTKSEIIVMVFSTLMGILFGGGLMHSQAKHTLPPCPGAVISAEYHKDGVMLCRYQQEPIGMKTYKEKQQVK